MEFIDSHPELPWNINNVFRNPNLTIEFAFKNKHKLEQKSSLWGAFSFRLDKQKFIDTRLWQKIHTLALFEHYREHQYNDFTLFECILNDDYITKMILKY